MGMQIPNAVAGNDGNDEESGDGTPWTETGKMEACTFLDDNTGYRLLVADAAAGSRFMSLK